MHIVSVVEEWRPGGLERIAIRLAGAWTRLGHRVTIICGNPIGPLGRLVDPAVTVVSPSRPIERSPTSQLRLAMFGSQVVRTLRPDVIFVPGNYYSGMIAALKLFYGPGLPPAVLKISNALRRRSKGRLAQLAYDIAFMMKTAFADHIVTMSAGLLAEARRRLPWRADLYSIIPQPVLDGHERASNHWGKGRIELVSAGRLATQKNWPLLIDAISLLKLDQPFHLTIYGEGDQREWLETEVERRGLSHLISLPGYVDQLSDVLANASLFTLTSDFEGFPSVLIEALAAGVPVVSTDCSPATEDIIRDPVLGTLVPPGDAQALATAIEERIAAGPPDRQKLMARAAEFRIDCSAMRYIELFNRLTAARL